MTIRQFINRHLVKRQLVNRHLVNLINTLSISQPVSSATVTWSTVSVGQLGNKYVVSSTSLSRARFLIQNQ